MELTHKAEADGMLADAMKDNSELMRLLFRLLREEQHQQSQ